MQVRNRTARVRVEDLSIDDMLGVHATELLNQNPILRHDPQVKKASTRRPRLVEAFVWSGFWSAAVPTKMKGSWMPEWHGPSKRATCPHLEELMVAEARGSELFSRQQED